jgi:hypothetical protein
MLPIILALAGTYLIIDSKKDKFADGGETDMNDMKISSVKITNINNVDKDDDLPKVIATLEDGSELFLFEYYPDEISFTKQEFVGLTPKQAIAKKNRKEEIYSMFSNNQVDFEKGGKMDKGGYMVFNYTDDIYASNDVFKNKTEANNFIKEFRKRFENQGYYRDNRMEKVAIEDIDLLAIPKNFNPYKKMAEGGTMNKGGEIKKGDLVRVKKYGWVMVVDKVDGKMYFLENDKRGTMNGNAGSYTKSDIQPIMAEGGSVNDDLENFDTNKLDEFEYMQFTNFTEKNKMSKKDALQILINNVEGDYSQLSPKLRAIAKKNKMADGDKMAKGGIIASSTSLEGIKKIIGNYYYSPNITLQKINDTDEYEVHNAKGKINSVKVIQKKGRFQFINVMADGGKM